MFIKYMHLSMCSNYNLKLVLNIFNKLQYYSMYLCMCFFILGIDLFINNYIHCKMCFIYNRCVFSLCGIDLFIFNYIHCKMCFNYNRRLIFKLMMQIFLINCSTYYLNYCVNYLIIIIFLYCVLIIQK